MSPLPAAMMSSVLAIVLAACGANATCGAGTGVAAVDLQRTLLQTKIGISSKGELERHKIELQSRIDQKKSAIANEKEDLDRARPTLSAGDVARRERQIQSDFDALKTDFAEDQRALTKQEIDLTRAIYVKVAPVIKSIAQRDGYRVVVEKNERAVLCPEHGEVPRDQEPVDITDEVNRTLDAAPQQ